jgi:hypothetical protein
MILKGPEKPDSGAQQSPCVQQPQAKWSFIAAQNSKNHSSWALD